MLPAWFVIFSVAIRLIGGTQYAWGVLHGKARPNPITWFLWGLTPIIAFFAQLSHGFSAQSLVLLTLGISPLVICVITLSKYNTREHFTPFSISCAALALVGIFLWQITAVTEVAIVFSILADIFATLPTLHKAYKDPSSEYSFPYLLSVVSMVIALLAVQDWVFTEYAFPLYMLGVNIILFAFAILPLRKLRRIGRRWARTIHA